MERKRIDRQGHTKISGYNSLNQQQKDLLKKLYIWRFHRAKDENRAVFMFLPDSDLLGLVQDIGHPEKYLSQRKIKAYGDDLNRIIKNC